MRWAKRTAIEGALVTAVAIALMALCAQVARPAEVTPEAAEALLTVVREHEPAGGRGAVFPSPHPDVVPFMVWKYVNQADGVKRESTDFLAAIGATGIQTWSPDYYTRGWQYAELQTARWTDERIAAWLVARSQEPTFLGVNLDCEQKWTERSLAWFAVIRAQYPQWRILTQLIEPSTDIAKGGLARPLELVDGFMVAFRTFGLTRYAADAVDFVAWGRMYGKQVAFSPQFASGATLVIPSDEQMRAASLADALLLWPSDDLFDAWYHPAHPQHANALAIADKLSNRPMREARRRVFVDPGVDYYEPGEKDNRLGQGFCRRSAARIVYYAGMMPTFRKDSADFYFDGDAFIKARVTREFKGRFWVAMSWSLSSGNPAAQGEFEAMERQIGAEMAAALGGGK